MKPNHLELVVNTYPPTGQTIDGLVETYGVPASHEGHHVGEILNKNARTPELECEGWLSPVPGQWMRTGRRHD